MKVFLYSGMQKMIEKSGVGRAIYHQKKAAAFNDIELVDNLKDADVVHINTIFPKSYELAKEAHKLGKKVVYHAHSTRQDFRNSYIGSNLVDGLFAWWIMKCYNSGDIIITPSIYSKKLLQSYGITKDIRVLSNGIDTSYYTRNEEMREEFKKKHKGRKVIMSAGLWIDRKGITDFVELAKRMPQYDFVWYGESNLYTVPAKIRKAVKTKLPNLSFPGYISKAELKDAYNNSDLFLFMSKEETEGIVILEALAMKIPTLIRDIPVYEGWLTDSKDVYKAKTLSEFETKITGILENKLPSVVEGGYNVAKERDIKEVGKRLKAIYEDASQNKLQTLICGLTSNLTKKAIVEKISTMTFFTYYTFSHNSYNFLHKKICHFYFSYINFYKSKNRQVLLQLKLLYSVYSFTSLL